MKGTVLKSTGSWYMVKIEDGRIMECRTAGKLKLNDLKLTNPIAVGDEVILEIEEKSETQAIIRQILPRKNYVVRQSPRKKHQLHFLASNLDQAMLIVTIKEPNLKLGFIDRFLIMTEPYSIPVIIVFNKADLLSDAEMNYYRQLEAVYTKIGYEVVLTSSVSGLGIDLLQAKLKNKTTLISGQSGVGKSTLVNKIEPTLTLRTEEISDFSGKGQHTTTFAEMFELSIGGRIIDTPGIKSLSFTHLDIKDIAHNFREFFVVSDQCKFSNCTHRNEPKCAVQEGVQNGDINYQRYINYLSLVDEVENQNYWEMHEDV